jgi:hypothetical protein
VESLIAPIVVAYIAVGILFSIFFAVSGVARLDSAAIGSPITFRILTIPAATALWPLLLTKMLRKRGDET